MEELLAFAYIGLIFEIGSKWQEYEDTLHKLFLEDPQSDFLLELESLCGNKKETIIYITNHTNFDLIDDSKFGRKLMSLLKPIYQSTDIRDFGKKINNLWKYLIVNFNEEPFCIFSYADDPLSWGDEPQSKGLYEYALSYYEYYNNDTA